MVMVNLQKPPVLVLATNPWLSGKLASAARKVGVNVKKFWYFRNPPPWSKYREYRRGASPKQLEVWDKFAEVSRSTRGMPIEERIRVIRERLAKTRGVVPAGGYLPPI